MTWLLSRGDSARVRESCETLSREPRAGGADWQADRAVRPVGAGLERVQWQALIVDRARRAREVEDDVQRLVETQGLDEVLIHEGEISAGVDVLDVLE